MSDFKKRARDYDYNTATCSMSVRLSSLEDLLTQVESEGYQRGRGWIMAVKPTKTLRKRVRDTLAFLGRTHDDVAFVEGFALEVYEEGRVAGLRSASLIAHRNEDLNTREEIDAKIRALKEKV